MGGTRKASEAGLAAFDGPAESFKPGWRFILAFLSLSALNLATALDATSISVTLPTITRQLGGDALGAFWCGTAFLLTSTVFQPAWVSLSHAIGRRDGILASMFFFTLGTILAGVAHGFALLQAGRAIQGFGGGGILVLSEVLVTDLVPLAERPKWINFITSVWAVGSVTGPVIGGAFAERVSWRWIFWINLPIIGVASVMIVAFLRLRQRPEGMRQKLMEMDFIGTFLFIASATAFLVPVTWGGVQYEWSSWHTLVPLVIGACGLVAFVCYEGLWAKTTLTPLQVFSNRSTVLCYLGITVHGILLWSNLYYLPLYYEAIKRYSPIISGVAMFPQTLTVIPSAIIVGLVVAKLQSYRWSLWMGWSLATLGTGLLCALGTHTTVAQWIFLTFVQGIGTGALLPATAISIMASAPQEHIAVAAGLIVFFRSLGQTLGVAIGGVVFQNRLRANLESSLELKAAAQSYAADATALVDVIKSLPQASSAAIELSQAYVSALQSVWIVMTALSAAALVSSIFIRSYSMLQDINTAHGFRHEEKEEDETSS